MSHFQNTRRSTLSDAQPSFLVLQNTIETKDGEGWFKKKDRDTCRLSAIRSSYFEKEKLSENKKAIQMLVKILINIESIFHGFKSFKHTDFRNTRKR